MAAFPALGCVANRHVVSDVQTKETCNKDDNDHYADNVENIHCVLRSRHARFQYESAALEQETSGPDGMFHHPLKPSAFRSLRHR
jgi:hypothetical protein